MTDEKVLQGLRACLEHKDCGKCPFVVNLNDCHSELAHEAYKTIERLRAENAALRERLEKAVELPCKVGDTVYLISQTARCPHGEVIEAKVTDFIGFSDGYRFTAKGKTEWFSFNKSDIGVWAFTTREVAEARLAELKGWKK